MNEFFENFVEWFADLFDSFGALIWRLVPGNSRRDEEERHSCLGAVACFLALVLIVGVVLWFVFRA